MRGDVALSIESTSKNCTHIPYASPQIHAIVSSVTRNDLAVKAKSFDAQNAFRPIALLDIVEGVVENRRSLPVRWRRI